MSTQRALSVILIFAAAALAGAQTLPTRREAPPGKVRGPWADARVGTKIEARDVQANVFNDIVTLKTMEVVGADDQSVTIKASGTVDGKAKKDQRGVIPRFLAPAELKKVMDAWGRKASRVTISIKGRDVACDVYELFKKDPEKNAEGTQSTYVSEQVPGWIVQIILRTVVEGRSGSSCPYQILDFNWGPGEDKPPARTDAPPKTVEIPKPDPNPAASAKPSPAPSWAETGYPDVPRSPESRQMAADAMARLSREAFTILDTDASGFEARYAVRKNDTPCGLVRATWSSEAGQTVSKCQGPLEAEDAAWLENLVTLGLLQSVFIDGDHEQLFGRRTEDGGFLLSDYKAVGEAVRSRQILLSADLSQTGEILSLANGLVRSIVRRAGKNGNRLFVGSARILIRTPEGERRLSDFSYEIGMRGGVPFVTRMAVTDTDVAGARTAWVLDLENLNLTKPAKRP